jgi:serine racemase
MWRAVEKHISPDNKLDSVADGMKTTLRPNTWPIIRDMVDDIITVPEESIMQATKIIWGTIKCMH